MTPGACLAFQNNTLEKAHLEDSRNSSKPSKIFLNIYEDFKIFHENLRFFLKTYWIIEDSKIWMNWRLENFIWRFEDFNWFLLRGTFLRFNKVVFRFIEVLDLLMWSRVFIYFLVCKDFIHFNHFIQNLTLKMEFIILTSNFPFPII